MLQKFSVLMSCYKNDNPNHLKIAIESIFNSSVLPDQYIIVVDGPVSIEIDLVLDSCVKKFPVIELQRLKENQGLGYALNFGLNKCKNNLVARMDSDDINCYYRFEKLLKEFRINNDLVVCGTFIEEFFDGSTKKLIRKVPLLKKDIFARGKYRNPLNHVSVMFNKSKIIEVGSYESVPFFEDYYLWIKLLMNDCEIKSINYIGVNVRAGRDMVSRRSGFNFIKNELYFLIKSYRLSYINILTLFVNLIIRIPIRLLGPLNNLTYKYILR